MLHENFTILLYQVILIARLFNHNDKIFKMKLKTGSLKTNVPNVPNLGLKFDSSFWQREILDVDRDS